MGFYPVGFNIVKETFESKSQLCRFESDLDIVGFNIVKETFESKSQLLLLLLLSLRRLVLILSKKHLKANHNHFQARP